MSSRGVSACCLVRMHHMTQCRSGQSSCARHAEAQMGVQGPQSSPDLETGPRRMGQGVNPPIRLGGDSVINGKGIIVRKMPRNSIKP